MTEDQRTRIADEILATIEENPVGIALALLEKAFKDELELRDLKRKNTKLAQMAVGFKEIISPDFNITAERFAR